MNEHQVVAFWGLCCLCLLWRWRLHGPPKRWYPTMPLHCVTEDHDFNFQRRENLKSRI